MYVIIEEGPAIFVLVLSAIFLGSFPVAFNWVELHGRKPAHTFLDFSAAFSLTGVPASLILSCTGPKWSFAPGFLVQMSEDNGFLIFCASLAGAFLMLGTMCLQYGLAYAGMAVCLPYLIAVSISVGMGIDWLMDTRMAKAQLLWVGLFCFSLSTFLGTLAHVARLKAIKAHRDRSAVGKVVGLDDLLSQRQGLAEACSGEVEVISLASNDSLASAKYRTGLISLAKQDSSDPNDVILDLESPAKASRRSKSLRDTPTGVMQDTNAFKDDDHAPPSSPKTKTSQFPMRAQYCVRAIEVTNSKPLAGIIVLSVGGLCFGLLTPLFFIATSSLPTTDHWRILSEGTPPLTVYNAFFFMVVTFFFVSWGWNMSLLYVPLMDNDESSVAEYVHDWSGRWASCAAGVACGLGMALQFMGGLGGGYYVAELVKLYPLLAAAWGVMMFKEFKGMGRKATLLFGGMCGTYILGVLLLAFSRNHSASA